MKKSSVLLSLILIMTGGKVFADDAAIKQLLDKQGWGSGKILPSPLPGMKTVLLEKDVLYISDDGKYVLKGPLYDMSSSQPVNLTNEILSKKVEELKDQMIVYKAPKPHYTVTVFTDITCSYCRKLHSEIPDYNALGITVRYLAFPREGMGGDVAKKMQSIWCSADRNKAFDAAMMNGTAPASASCNIDLAAQHRLGLLYGIYGTPAILLPNNVVIPGYQSPGDLKAYLDSQKSRH